MPVEMIGMVTGQVVSEIRFGLEPCVDPAVIAEFAHRHEAAAFDRVLLGYSAVEADTWLIASHVLHSTRNLRVLVAHRPGFVAPTLAARKAATLEALHGRGRVALNVVSGGS